MPIQDNEDKRTSGSILPDAEEELRRKAALSQENENSVQKSGKLLPFLNAKAQHHQSRIDNLDSKIATQQNKIAKHTAKIEQLGAKADKLEDTNRMLKAAIGNLPFVQKLIKRNEKRIADIRENKIPNRQNKLKSRKIKIEQFTAKRKRISHKLNRVIALNDTIKSFSIGLNKERREIFADAMDRLNEAAYNCLSDKRKSLAAQKQEIVEKYNAPETNVVDKHKLQAKINELSSRIQSVDDRMEKVWQPDEFYVMQSDDVIDAQMKLTSDKIADMTKSDTVAMPDLAEKTLFAALETEEFDKSQIASLADEFKAQPINKVEEQVEDDLSMIDGIINNGSKADLDKAKAELLDGIKSMQVLADNPFVSKEMHDMAVQNLAQLKEQLSAVNEAINKFDTPIYSPDALDEINAEGLMAESEISVENWLIKMVDEGKAEFTDNGGFKVNPDYYKELPRNDRHVEPMTEAQAVAVMSALTAAGIEFSAASRGENKVGITVSKKNIVALNDIMQDSIGKAVELGSGKVPKSEVRKNHYQTVNPDYYKSLPKDQRHTRVEPKDAARKIVSELQKSDILYSAVVRKNDTVAITVSESDAQTYKQIESNVKGERAVEFVDPDFFKSPPKQERFTQRMNENQAKAKPVASVAKKETKTAYFPRSLMRKEAQRVKQQGKQSPEKSQHSIKKNNQGLD